MSRFLMEAAGEGNVDKVRKLLEKGAEVDWRHKATGRTPLSEAAIQGNLEVARVLVEYGADLNWRDSAVGFSPLGWACECKHPELVEFFLKAGADPNLATPEFLITPLMIAAGHGDVSVIKLLLAAGADVNAPASDGRTPLKFAQTHKRADAIKLLEEAGGSAENPLPVPERIPWPAVDETGKTCDDSTPESVLRSFIFAMNRFEKNAHALSKKKGASAAVNAEILSMMQTVFDRYCTPIDRPRGRQGSYRIPPEYDPDGEVLTEVRLTSPRRAELTTRDKDQRNEFLYVLQKKKDGWLIDKKKWRPIGAKWRSWSL